ncbi:hypothetical protein LJC10_04865, partial [Selenomonadales bacterium OttesenSCG-928-I06]|nr:hypothetical protein [Selenomonadales bacterium OttesenSCG-928-I06]
MRNKRFKTNKKLTMAVTCALCTTMFMSTSSSTLAENVNISDIKIITPDESGNVTGYGFASTENKDYNITFGENSRDFFMLSTPNSFDIKYTELEIGAIKIIGQANNNNIVNIKDFSENTNMMIDTGLNARNVNVSGISVENFEKVSIDINVVSLYGQAIWGGNVRYDGTGGDGGSVNAVGVGLSNIKDGDNIKIGDFFKFVEPGYYYVGDKTYYNGYYHEATGGINSFVRGGAGGNSDTGTGGNGGDANNIGISIDNSKFKDIDVSYIYSAINQGSGGNILNNTGVATGGGGIGGDVDNKALKITNSKVDNINIGAIFKAEHADGYYHEAVGGINTQINISSGGFSLFGNNGNGGNIVNRDIYILDSEVKELKVAGINTTILYRDDELPPNPNRLVREIVTFASPVDGLAGRNSKQSSGGNGGNIDNINLLVTNSKVDNIELGAILESKYNNPATPPDGLDSAYRYEYQVLGGIDTSITGVSGGRTINGDAGNAGNVINKGISIIADSEVKELTVAKIKTIINDLSGNRSSGGVTTNGDGGNGGEIDNVSLQIKDSKVDNIEIGGIHSFEYLEYNYRDVSYDINEGFHYEALGGISTYLVGSLGGATTNGDGGNGGDIKNIVSSMENSQIGEFNVSIIDTVLIGGDGGDTDTGNGGNGGVIDNINLLITNSNVNNIKIGDIVEYEDVYEDNGHYYYDYEYEAKGGIDTYIIGSAGGDADSVGNAGNSGNITNIVAYVDKNSNIGDFSIVAVETEIEGMYGGDAVIGNGGDGGDILNKTLLFKDSKADNISIGKLVTYTHEHSDGEFVEHSNIYGGIETEIEGNDGGYSEIEGNGGKGGSITNKEIDITNSKIDTLDIATISSEVSAGDGGDASDGNGGDGGNAFTTGVFITNSDVKEIIVRGDLYSENYAGDGGNSDLGTAGIGGSVFTAGLYIEDMSNIQEISVGNFSEYSSGMEISTAGGDGFSGGAADARGIYLNNAGNIDSINIGGLGECSSGGIDIDVTGGDGYDSNGGDAKGWGVYLNNTGDIGNISIGGFNDCSLGSISIYAKGGDSYDGHGADAEALGLYVNDAGDIGNITAKELMIRAHGGATIGGKAGDARAVGMYLSNIGTINNIEVSASFEGVAAFGGGTSEADDIVGTANATGLYFENIKYIEAINPDICPLVCSGEGASLSVAAIGGYGFADLDKVDDVKATGWFLNNTNVGDSRFSNFEIYATAGDSEGLSALAQGVVLNASEDFTLRIAQSFNVEATGGIGNDTNDAGLATAIGLYLTNSNNVTFMTSEGVNVYSFGEESGDITSGGEAVAAGAIFSNVRNGYIESGECGFIVTAIGGAGKTGGDAEALGIGLDNSKLTLKANCINVMSHSGAGDVVGVSDATGIMLRNYSVLIAYAGDACDPCSGGGSGDEEKEISIIARATEGSDGVVGYALDSKQSTAIFKDKVEFTGAVEIKDNSTFIIEKEANVISNDLLTSDGKNLNDGYLLIDDSRMFFTDIENEDKVYNTVDNYNKITVENGLKLEDKNDLYMRTNALGYDENGEIEPALGVGQGDRIISATTIANENVIKEGSMTTFHIFDQGMKYDYEGSGYEYNNKNIIWFETDAEKSILIDYNLEGVVEYDKGSIDLYDPANYQKDLDKNFEAAEIKYDSILKEITYQPLIEFSGRSDDPDYEYDIRLAGIEKKKEDPGIIPKTSHDSHLALAGFFRDDDTLLKRLGDIRDNAEPGMWIRYKRTEQEIRIENGIDQKKYGFNVGFDQKAGDKWLVGVAYGLYESDNYYKAGKGEIESKDLVVYGTYLGDKGHYLDLVGKYSSLGNEFDAWGGSGD